MKIIVLTTNVDGGPGTQARQKQPISTFHSDRPNNLPPTIPLKEGYDPFLMSLRTCWEDQIPWGEKHGNLSKNRDVLELAWKDNRMVLFISTVHSGKCLPSLINPAFKAPSNIVCRR